ncbi:MAG: PepSY domain-containing protein [Candidatus Marinimicrobia bacterium]|nr:PepSY domain-containing protein [Candidatus Neomarinimicrobiota bacterium]
MKKKINWSKWTRKTHYWVSAVIILPILIVIITGILLQLKKEINWIQPPTIKGQVQNNPIISFDDILNATRTAEEANIKSWDDIDRLDVRIEKGIVKVRGKNRWEVQIDTKTKKVLQVAYRRSDLIEQLHDGSWFNDKVKLYIFLPSGIILFILWLTGLYMFILPYAVKWNKKKR